MAAVEANSIEAIQTLHFDFEKNLPSPKLSTSESYYTRFLYTNSFGIYSALHNKMSLYMFPEFLARKTADDVISLFYHFFTENEMGKTGCKHLYLFGDNCSGTNKNFAMLWLCDFLVRSKMFTTVNLVFLVAGHSFGPADRFFAQVEQKGRVEDIINGPADWMNLAESVENIAVVKIQQESFRDFREWFSECYAKTTSDTSGNKFLLSNHHWFAFGGIPKFKLDGKGVATISSIEMFEHCHARVSYDHDELPRVVDYRKKAKSIDDLPLTRKRLYLVNPLPLSHLKVRDLKKLAQSFLINEEAVKMYMALTELPEEHDKTTTKEQPHIKRLDYIL